MTENEVIACPTCKGKGYHRDGGIMALTLLCPIWTVVALADNGPNGIAMCKCKQCRGKGFIRITTQP